MKVCQTCNQRKANKQFAGKAEHCRDCDTQFISSVMSLVKEHYKPTYPPHIQEYLDKRKERLEKEGK